MTRLRSLFRRLFAGRSTSATMQVLLYTKRECHLCQTAKDQIKQVLKGHVHSLEEIDIESDPELMKRFGEEIPVVAINGKIRFKGTVNPVLLKRLVRTQR